MNVELIEDLVEPTHEIVGTARLASVDASSHVVDVVGGVHAMLRGERFDHRYPRQRRFRIAGKQNQRWSVGRTLNPHERVTEGRADHAGFRGDRPALRTRIVEGQVLLFQCSGTKRMPRLHRHHPSPIVGCHRSRSARCLRPSISRLITRLTGLVQRARRQPQKPGPQVTSLTDSTTRGADPGWNGAREPSGIWQAAESERASAYYADNNENPIWDDDYFVRCRDSHLIKLEQAEQALQEIATAQNRSVPDRADDPAYQGPHWVSSASSPTTRSISMTSSMPTPEPRNRSTVTPTTSSPGVSRGRRSTNSIEHSQTTTTSNRPRPQSESPSPERPGGDPASRVATRP